MFCSKLPVKITMVKRIVRIYKYNQCNWTYPYKNTTFDIPPHFDTFIKTQHNSASYDSTGEND